MLIAAARKNAGIETQGELAALLGRAQQSVSRWEAGTSRPRADEVATLAAALKCQSDELLAAAGYKPLPSLAGIITFDKPLPLENLPPDSFERFLAALVAGLYPEAVINRAGVSGHAQEGLDVTAQMPDGKIHSYQCKRVQTFGPAEIERAVKQHTAVADRKVLVLSRVASPKALAEIHKHRGWEIWDKEDLSRKLRSLSPEAQARLVDTFFPGRRPELLGRPDPGPWLDLEQFFQPYEARDAAFSHDWQLKGREAELAQLASALADPDSRMVLVTAPGGEGKSRLIKEALTSFREDHPRVLVRFLSSTSTTEASDLEDLGSGPKLIVVDDAHDREDLSQVFEYVARGENNARLLVASRPYGAEKVTGLAAVRGVAGLKTVIVEPLSKDDLLALAREVLHQFGGHSEWASHVVAAAGRSPLITVMAARVMAKERVPPGLTFNQEEPRRFILGKFEKVVVGDLGSTADQAQLRELIELLALIQPFDIQDPFFNSMVESILGFDEVVTARLMRLLSDGGIIFKRGRLFRLMPDVLGDFLIDRSCVDANGNLSPFAKQVFEQARDRHISRVLLNLGRLDWRRSDGDASRSTLLAGVWRTLDEIEDPYDRRLDAIYEVAAYQPVQALEFVQRQLQVGRNFREFPKILRRIALTGECFNDACELLWEIGKGDSRDLGPNPEHALRMLSELTSIERHKPFDVTEKTFEFGMELSRRPGVWASAYSPLDIMTPILKADGITTIAKHTHFEMAPFLVNYETVVPYRVRLVDRLLELIGGDDPAAGRRAAQALENALRRPMPSMGLKVPDETYQAYDREFCETLRKVQDLFARQKIHPAVAIGIARAIAWHANYGAGEPSKLAKKVLASLPDDLAFRTAAILSDGWGHTFLGRMEPKTWQEELNRWVSGLVDDLRTAHNDREKLRDFVEQVLLDLGIAGQDRGSSHVLLISLIREDLDFARALLTTVEENPDSPLSLGASFAITELLSGKPDEGRRMLKKWFASKVRALRIVASSAFGGVRRPLDGEDFALMLSMVADDDPSVAATAIRTAMALRDTDPAELLELVRQTNVGISDDVADDLCMLIGASGEELIKGMSERDVEGLLRKLARIPELEGYWINKALAYFSEHFALLTATFLMDRVDYFSEPERFGASRAVNHGPYTQDPLRFRKSKDALAVLRRTWDWLSSHKEREIHFDYNAAHLFETMFRPLDGEIVELLAERVEEGDAAELLLMASLLREAPPQFVFNERDFVIAYLERCRSVDAELVKHAQQALFISATSGMRNGNVGQAAPQDIKMRERADEAVKSVSRLSPAHRLYSDIRTHGDWSINQWLGDRVGDDE
jgi:transcriptional regulator with XRE-family HTH domain